MRKGFCSACGTRIYREERWRIKLTGTPSLFTQIVEEWPDKLSHTAERVQYPVFLATEMGPEICHCPHCGLRIEGAELC